MDTMAAAMDSALPAALLAAIEARVGPEWMAWYALSPADRWLESARLWQSYVALGGSFDPLTDNERPLDVAGPGSPPS